MMPAAIPTTPGSPRLRRLLVAGGAAVTTVASLAAVVSSSPAGAASGPTVSAYGANAFGSLVKVGTTVSSGPSAYQPMCTTVAPFTKANNTAAVRLPSGLGLVGATVNRVAAGRSGTARTSAGSSYTVATKLLPGDVIKASVISSIARLKQIGSTFAGSGASTVAGLTIAGHAVPVTGAVNQSVPLPIPGVRLILNSRRGTQVGHTHYYIVDALLLIISGSNTLGLPASTIILGHSLASMHELTYRATYGAAWATSVQLGSLVESGRTASVYLPCGGTDSATVRNSVATLVVPVLGGVGAVSSSAHSYDGAASSTANTESHIANLNLLGGKVRIAALAVKATTTRTATNRVIRSASGTSILGLVINGMAQSAPAPNTSRTVPGLGTLYFYRSIATANGIVVYGLVIVLKAAFGSFKAGSTIVIGAAAASVSPY